MQRAPAAMPPDSAADAAMHMRAAELREIAQAPTLEDLLDVVAAPDHAGLRLSVVLELKGRQWGNEDVGPQAASALLEVLRACGALLDSHDQQDSGAARGRERRKPRPDDTILELGARRSAVYSA